MIIIIIIIPTAINTIKTIDICEIKNEPAAQHNGYSIKSNYINIDYIQTNINNNDNYNMIIP